MYNQNLKVRIILVKFIKKKENYARNNIKRKTNNDGNKQSQKRQKLYTNKGTGNARGRESSQDKVLNAYYARKNLRSSNKMKQERSSMNGIQIMNIMIM